MKTAAVPEKTHSASAEPKTGPELTKTPDAPEAGWKRSLRRSLGFIALQTLLVGGVYGYARFEASRKIDAANAHTAEAATRTQQAEARTLEVRRALWRLEARLTLERGLAALDQRNFGTARTLLAEAASRLAASAPEAGTGLAALHTRLSSFELSVSDDIGPARALIVEWLAELDKATPISPAPSAVAPPAADQNRK